VDLQADMMKPTVAGMTLSQQIAVMVDARINKLHKAQKERDNLKLCPQASAKVIAQPTANAIEDESEHKNAKLMASLKKRLHAWNL
jgi:hypothetical protein